MHPLTHLCFLLLLLGRFSLLALPLLLGTCLPSQWSPPFPPHAPTLIPLSRQGAVLAHLTLSHHTMGRSGQTPLFLFLRAKAALAYLPTALFEALRLLFPFQQAQYAQVFHLKPMPFCELFAGLGSTNKFATSSLLLLSDSRHLVFSSVFPFTAIFLAGTVSSLFLLNHATMGPQTLVSPGEQFS